MKNIRSLIEGILTEVLDSSGHAKVDSFFSLRDVDRKRDEFLLLLKNLPHGAAQIIEAAQIDQNFEANSRRIRLESLGHYCRMALKFLDGGIVKPQKQIFKAPDLSKLTSSMPNLEEIIQSRWLEVQKCQHTGCYLASVILMGSILEALLLGKTLSCPSEAFQAKKSPKKKDGSNLPIPDWNLNSLIEVAVELGWLKVDRGKFSHALRESRNVVHPWQHAALRANFDEATCRTCWEVLNASVEDLTSSS